MREYLEIWHDEGTDVLPLAGVQMTIGRSSSNDIPLDDSTASRRHAMLERLAAGWSIHDLGSLNGTYINGEPVEQPRPLYPGDEIVVGDTRLVYRTEPLP